MGSSGKPEFATTSVSPVVEFIRTHLSLACSLGWSQYWAEPAAKLKVRSVRSMSGCVVNGSPSADQLFLRVVTDVGEEKTSARARALLILVSHANLKRPF